ncbi:hypothetical protein PYCCODRAFT_617123 [Trametes coccinea BRFM310]|uniref:Uncharacterized protein n=1 Tax=Trametes coccinea (strain BRFM310) TaxID=1353009 RepID=A0A1Y2J258_TRAC3|nr:hypothetical protein PYCCODRAFT_617123 [Trametes coccinea BRFM310]
MSSGYIDKKSTRVHASYELGTPNPRVYVRVPGESKGQAGAERTSDSGGGPTSNHNADAQLRSAEARAVTGWLVGPDRRRGRRSGERWGADVCVRSRCDVGRERSSDAVTIRKAGAEGARVQGRTDRPERYVYANPMSWQSSTRMRIEARAACMATVKAEGWVNIRLASAGARIRCVERGRGAEW